MFLTQVQVKIISNQYQVKESRVQHYANLLDTLPELFEELENWNDSHLVMSTNENYPCWR